MDGSQIDREFTTRREAVKWFSSFFTGKPEIRDTAPSLTAALQNESALTEAITSRRPFTVCGFVDGQLITPARRLTGPQMFTATQAGLFPADVLPFDLI
jgi:hypothetical protein